jgi:farnesyl diphosphate synthase
MDTPIPSTDALRAAMAEAAAEIDRALDILIPPAEGPEARLFEAMRYAAIGGGKRLRGFLVLEGARQFGVSRDAALRVGRRDRDAARLFAGA